MKIIRRSVQLKYVTRNVSADYKYETGNMKSLLKKGKENVSYLFFL